MSVEICNIPSKKCEGCPILKKAAQLMIDRAGRLPSENLLYVPRCDKLLKSFFGLVVQRRRCVFGFFKNESFRKIVKDGFFGTDTLTVDIPGRCPLESE